MEDRLLQSPEHAAAEAAGDRGNNGVGLLAQQYEILFRMTGQMLLDAGVSEQVTLALEFLTAEMGYTEAAIALIDERNSTLCVRMAVGFPSSASVEKIEMPLDSGEPGVSVIYNGQPAWISRDSEHSFAGGNTNSEDIFAIPLFGVLVDQDNPDGDAPRIVMARGRFWEPEATCIGVLFVGSNRSCIAPETIKFLQLFAHRVGFLIASAIRTERLVAKVTELQRERQRVESIMESVADPIVLTNIDNEILLQNRRAEQLFSGSEEASEGKRRALKLNDLLFSAYLSSGTVSSTETLGKDLTLVDPIEGSEIHFEVVSTPALNERDERIGLVSVFRDVTDLRKANEELARNYKKLTRAEAESRRERDRLNLIIENVGHPVVVTDASGNFELFNRRAGLLFQHEQLLVRRAESPDRRVEPATSRSLAAVRANSVKLTSFISGLASESHSDRQAEIELIDPETAESLPMEITSVEVLDNREQVTAVVSVLHDLSEIRELERRRIEQKLFESEKLAALGTLAASVAHEVNNPLEAIKNSLYLLQAKKDQASTSRFLEIALKETQRVSQIIRQLLGFARPSGIPERVDINQLIEDTLTLLERKLHHAGIILRQKLEPRLPPVNGYADQLRQVWLNVILNAQQSLDGGGTITIKTMRYKRPGQPSVLIEISDTGPGISQENIERIFEPFFSMRKEGTGLGLWVTHNIVRQHGGQIEVTGNGDKGTAFRIILPIDAPGPTTPKEQEER
ncbi:MAG: hypothetical protein DMF61_12210 [Blastocatellia bacterium AA13]|nr:MAG: hypothetical protein DMF61_12210 [Blastocatellia bacterium AA13]